jgi:DNA helicase-2/ATP-dependent DNA helicase PcrA
MLSGAELDNAVQLMTAHAAKGLEFPHTFIIRANSGSFPGAFHETLFEFPAELRDSVAAGDDKQVHAEEERRLFYVAMTRARDTLAICAKPGRGKKEPRPAGLLRDLMIAAKPACWSQRPARPYTVELQAAAAPAALSGVASWLLLPPRPMQGHALSASAVEMYENCPLQFKLERDWNIPGPVAASMQFGSAIHLVLKGYFDALLAARPITEQQVLELFREALGEQPFEDEYQRELYAERGAQQLRAFVARHPAGATPPVIGTESPFEIKVAGVRVRGRIDRLDRISADAVAVVDYKTGTPWTEKKADLSLQLSIYAIAARERWQLQAERLVIYNVQDNTQVTTTRDPGQLADAEERVRTAAANIAAERFHATPGFHCDWCSYRDLCPPTEANLAVAPAPID